MALSYLHPGVYVEEVPGGTRSIQALGTSVAAFVGVAPDPARHLHQAVAVHNWTEFQREFVSKDSPSTPLSNAVYGFFQNNGGRCFVVNVGAGGLVSGGGRGGRKGIDVLEEIDEVSMVACPGFWDAESYDALLTHCEKMRFRVALLDAPPEVANVSLLTQVATAKTSAPAPGADKDKAAAAGVRGVKPRKSDGGHGSFFFPHLVVRDALDPSKTVTAPPCGHLAGIYARTDAVRGVHKAPANEIIRGALDVTYHVTAEEQGLLNPQGVNCLRLFGADGVRVWGARTLADAASEWRYTPVRRLFAMMEHSIARGTQWVVFEPNSRPLWKAIERDISAFLTLIWRQGALMGDTPEQAFFVKCDEETNPPDVVDAGQVVTLVGCAPVKPAEFVVFRIGQTALGADVGPEKA